MVLEFAYETRTGRGNHVILLHMTDRVILYASTAQVQVPENAYSALSMHIEMLQVSVYAKTTELVQTAPRRAMMVHVILTAAYNLVVEDQPQLTVYSA